MREEQHPLFDSQGYYRHATRQSLWRDGGDASIQAYFLAKAYQDQRQRYRSLKLQQSSIDWGYDDATNAQISTFMTGRRLKMEKPPYSLGLAAGVGAGPGLGQLAPSLLIADPVGSPLTPVREGKGPKAFPYRDCIWFQVTK